MTTDSSIITYKGISRSRLNELLNSISNKRIGFIGDFCIDIYWYADMTRSEISRETPHYPLPVVEEKYQLGAGGNVVANLAALNPKKISIVGVIGNDWRGMLVRKCLKNINIETELIVEIEGHTTNAYCKPMRKGLSDVVYEDPRIDFTGSAIDARNEEKIIANLRVMAKSVDIICVSDQFLHGCVTEKVRSVLCDIGKNRQIVVDSRDRISEYRNVIIKPNEVETVKAANKLCGLDNDRNFNRKIEEFVKAGRILNERLGCDVSMTIGKDGNIQIHDQKAYHVLPRDIKGPIDFCGAGDTFLAAYTCTLAAGGLKEEAGQIAGMASEVTISKIGQTGTATASEIAGRYAEAYEQIEE